MGDKLPLDRKSINLKRVPGPVGSPHETVLAVYVGKEVVVRAPSLREDISRKTEPGSVMWVLSKSSPALDDESRKYLGHRLSSGALALATVPLAKVKASAKTGVSVLTEAEVASLLEARKGVQAGVEARREAAKAMKAHQAALKKLKALPVSPALLAAIAEIEAKINQD